jgi:hypothetical protein
MEVWAAVKPFTDGLSVDHFFILNPGGHLGFTAVTFLVSLPLTQAMVVFFSAAALAAARIRAA